ncbi:glycosyltransferase family 1 protein [Actibacterium ureilyticum]|uniref:glycosyltransferase family 1 protein n=1 Tax=Actibacterium ureilyticum TaxID=1590614 RepID=UPI000BAB00B2|nr:glycosyltransferase family 1 protein [Actibacterium ureilyticum]
MSQDFDILVVADCRFSGGTTAALVNDVQAFSRMGARVGLFFVRSAYLDDSRDPANPKALALLDLPGVTALRDGVSARAPVAFLHHPLVFFRGIEERANLTADRSVVVAHHTPFRADGSLEYDPVMTARRVRQSLGLSPWFAPVSGVIRSQLESFAPLIRLTTEDWPNVFDTDAWQSKRPILTGPKLVIGRHGRADGLKWPATAEQINAALPAGPDITVRVLGCPQDDLRQRGADLSGWEILEFGAEDPVDFLNSLDVFTYHYHPNWVEAFGRTIAEAALCGRPCLLEPRLRATFGDIAQYCTAMEVPDALARLRADPDATRAMAAHGQSRARDMYAQQSVAGRLERLTSDTGITRRQSPQAPPLTVLRKLAGLYRRRSQGADG